MIREVSFKSYDVGYNNIALEIKEEDFKVEVVFGLIYITIGCNVIYSHVIRIDGLSKWGIIKKSRPIIEDTLRNNGVNINIRY